MECDDILLFRAVDLLDRMQHGELSAAELIDRSLERIREFNPSLRAVVAVAADEARAAAVEADRRLREGTARPLEGLPFTVKDSFDVRGLPTTVGSPLYRDRIPVTDATAVARLRAAGAIILGKTNVSEMLGDLQCFNPLHGVTRHPIDKGRSPGGSSGGSAVAVASGMSAGDLGSDLCGSIRWPAHCCGVVGLKPSWGAVPMSGHVPPPPGTTTPTPFSTGGPLARSVADAALLFDVLAGGGSTVLNADATGLRVAVWPYEAGWTIEPQIQDAVLRAGAYLSDVGAQVDPARRPAFFLEEAVAVFGLYVHAILGLGLDEGQRSAILASSRGDMEGKRCHARLRAQALALDEPGWADVDRRRMALARAWSAFFADIDVLLCPAAPVLAIPHDAGHDPYARTIRVSDHAVSYMELINWHSLASVADLPALVVPIGTSNGLPIGVQIIGRTEREVLGVGQIIERRMRERVDRSEL